jgi:hypothetical protein
VPLHILNPEGDEFLFARHTTNKYIVNSMLMCLWATNPTITIIIHFTPLPAALDWLSTAWRSPIEEKYFLAALEEAFESTSSNNMSMRQLVCMSGADCHSILVPNLRLQTLAHNWVAVSICVWVFTYEASCQWWHIIKLSETVGGSYSFCSILTESAIRPASCQAENSKLNRVKKELNCGLH